MKEVKEIKKLGDWITKKDAMEFLGYKTTQMHHFMKDNAHLLEVSRVRRRTFITISSLLMVFEQHKV
jgi:hypothetical protein